jgi:hypothetical protein
MRGITTVDSFLKSMNVTAEELELHKDLIEECLENERRIGESSDATKKNIERISRILETVYKNVVTMEAALESLTKGAEELSLRMLLADRFYRE